MIEPHAVTTVSTPAIRTARQDKPATLAEYLANIASRFPECVTASGAANPAALAKRENRAMRFSAGRQEDRATSTASSPASSERVQAQRAAWEAKREARDLAILDFLTDDFRTSGDVATRFKISLATAQHALRAMKDEGLIVTAKTRRVTIYRKAGLEAEPQKPEKGVSTPPVAISVRGQAFPSLRACARHFGISVQAVHDAARKGKLDGIGTRRMEAAE